MTSRGEITDEAIGTAIESLVDKTKQRLKQKGYGALASRHEILGILEEELYEFKMAVHDGNDVQRVEELLDIAVGAIFGIVSIGSRKVDW